MGLEPLRSPREASLEVESETEGQGPCEKLVIVAHPLLGGRVVGGCCSPCARGTWVAGWDGASHSALSCRTAWTDPSGPRCSAARPAAMTWAGAMPCR